MHFTYRVFINSVVSSVIVFRRFRVQRANISLFSPHFIHHLKILRRVSTHNFPRCFFLPDWLCRKMRVRVKTLMCWKLLSLKCSPWASYTPFLWNNLHVTFLPNAIYMSCHILFQSWHIALIFFTIEQRHLLDLMILL